WAPAGGGVLEAAVLRRPRIAAAGALLVIAAAAPGLARLEVGDNWLENFAPDAAPVTADRAFNRHFWGSYRFDVVLEGRPELFYHPDGARLVEQVSALATALPEVSGALSHLDAVEVVMRAHGETGPASALPAERLADFAVLAAMTEDPGGAGGFVTADGAHSRVRLFLRGEDFARDRRLLDRLGSRLDALAARHDIEYHFSGDIPKGLRMVREIVRHQLVSVGLSYLLIGLIALTLDPRGSDGLVVLAPLFASMLVVFGIMGYAGIRLGIATTMFSSLTIGVGVDFGLHLAAAWRRARERGEAAATALRTAGRAVRWNAAVLATGFAVLALSALRPNHALGLLLVLGIGMAYLLTVLLLPALLALRLAPWRPSARRTAQRPRPGTAVLLLVLSAGLAAAAPAAAAPAADDDPATALMAEVERRFGSFPRVVRMTVVTTRPAAVANAVEPPREEVVLWGVVAGDGAASEMLFVFAEPGRFAGIGLLLRSRTGRPDGDEMWYRMRTFDRFRRVPRSSRKLRIPGTALTYEDAHGFLAANRYGFAPAAADPGPAAGAGTAHLVARPGLPGLAADLGFASAAVTVDRARRLVTRIELRSADGRALRRYRVERSHRLGELWLPERATVLDVASGVLSRVEYRYWPVDTLPDGLFSTGPDATPLLERLRPVLTGVGARQPIAAAAGVRSRPDP
ncbi:MAG TPA: outer membrane lipoprotein-sorting protein, partial [Thermoanaerobaculia bacterium]|nr:outer membrane lipoprotein-sorting protein [Thermoanaerobaculia bacterium]